MLELITLVDSLLALRLRELQARELYREPESDAREAAMAAARRRQVTFIDASSNDYLGLARSAPPSFAPEPFTPLAHPATNATPSSFSDTASHARASVALLGAHPSSAPPDASASCDAHPRSAPPGADLGARSHPSSAPPGASAGSGVHPRSAPPGASAGSGVDPRSAPPGASASWGAHPRSAPPGASASWGAGASRLIHGTHDAHRQLETSLASWLQREDALLFSSGYAANVGVLSSLAAAGDLIVSDALNHASLIDGARLSRARVEVVPHRDVEAVAAALRTRRERTAWVVTESYFSMDGHVAPLAELAAACRRYDAALIVDEAHALGVFGPSGRGLAASASVRADVLIGTFGKAFGAQGAFVAGSRLLRSWLWNTARSFVFSTATSPALAQFLISQLGRVRSADDRRHQLQRHCQEFEQRLRQTPSRSMRLSATRTGPIFPLLCGTPAAAIAAARHLGEHGILAQAIRPPTVPQGTSRVRLSLQATLTAAQLERLATTLKGLG